MEPSTSLEDLPFTVFYQCRMCTDLFFEDVEKMFAHLEKRHGGMIDCEELKSSIYANGLRVGPVPTGSPSSCSATTVKVEEDDHHEAIIGKAEIEEEEDQHNDGVEFDRYSGENEEYLDEEQYEEEPYVAENGEVVPEGMKYTFNVHDDDEQLEARDDYDEVEAGIDEDDEQYDPDETQAPETLATLPQGYNYAGEDYEDGSEGLEPTFDGDEMEEGEQLYDEDEQLDEEVEEEEEDEEAENGVYSNGNRQNGLLNYGYSCKFCGKFFTTQRGCETHEQHHINQTLQPTSRSSHPKVFPCKICKKITFQSFKDLKQHVKTHSAERIHICKFCFSTFNNTASLTKHLGIHNRENPNKCHCGKTFVSANTLKIHKKIHTGIKPFVCEFYECGRAFVTKSTLESHLRTHTGEKPYACFYCSSSFTTSSAKYRHERHVHKAHTDTAVE